MKVNIFGIFSTTTLKYIYIPNKYFMHSGVNNFSNCIFKIHGCIPQNNLGILKYIVVF